MKKLFALALILLTTLSLVTGCAQPAASPSDSAQPDGLPTVGLLQYAPHPSLDNCREGFLQGLAQEGFKDGENVNIDYQNADNKGETCNLAAQNFVSKKYDLICAIATPAAVAAHSAAQEQNIPVVFTAVSDPVTAKLASSLQAPGLGATGTCDALPLEEQMQLIRAFLPEAKTIGVLYTTSEVNSQSHLKAFEELAPQYGFTIVSIGIAGPSDIPLAVDTLLPQVDCVNNFTDNNVVTNLQTLLSKANEAGVPVFGSEVEQVRNGCVAARSIDYVALGKETGVMAAKILKGEADASSLAVQVISESQPVANQSVMDALHITAPQGVELTYVTAEE